MSIERLSKKDIWNPYFYKDFNGFASITPLWKALRRPYHQGWPSVDDYNAFATALNVNQPLCFIEQDLDMRYLWEIYYHDKIPTRTANWHDFFNNLTWLAFPRLKRAIVKKMCETQNWDKTRTPLQNTLAHFDECGMVICSDKPELFELIQAFEWKTFFCQEKLQEHCLPILIGHGMMEKALKPFVGMTAKAVFLKVEPDFFKASTFSQNQLLDERIAAFVECDEFPSVPKALQPFPFLGWPTWHHHQDEAFYHNHAYFRPKRLF